MFRKVEISTLVVLFIFTFYCGLVTQGFWDEPFEMRIGKERLKYIFSLGSNKDFQNQPEGSRFYPGTYSVIAVFITKMFPLALNEPASVVGSPEITLLSAPALIDG